jgi:transposase-like protein
MLYQLRKRTELEDIVYSLHLYFSSGLSLRNTSKTLSRFVQRSHHTAIRDWIQKYKPERLSYKKVIVSKFIIDENSTSVLNISGYVGLL